MSYDKDPIKRVVSQLEHRLACVRAIIKFAESFDVDSFPPCRLDARDGDGLEFLIKDLSQLHDVREYLRKHFGSWRDRVRVAARGGSAWAIWSDSEHRDVTIELWTTPEEFPKELIGEACGFVEQTDTYEVYACGIK